MINHKTTENATTSPTEAGERRVPEKPSWRPTVTIEESATRNKTPQMVAGNRLRNPNTNRAECKSITWLSD